MINAVCESGRPDLGKERSAVEQQMEGVRKYETSRPADIKVSAERGQDVLQAWSRRYLQLRRGLWRTKLSPCSSWALHRADLLRQQWRSPWYCRSCAPNGRYSSWRCSAEAALGHSCRPQRRVWNVAGGLGEMPSLGDLCGTVPEGWAHGTKPLKPLEDHSGTLLCSEVIFIFF